MAIHGWRLKLNRSFVVVLECSGGCVSESEQLSPFFKKKSREKVPRDYVLICWVQIQFLIYSVHVSISSGSNTVMVTNTSQYCPADRHLTRIIH